MADGNRVNKELSRTREEREGRKADEKYGGIFC